MPIHKLAHIVPSLAIVTLAFGSAQSQPTSLPTSQPAAPEASEPVAPEASPPAEGFTPPPLFAALFEQGRSWRYSGVFETTFWDDEDPEADEYGNVTTREELSFACNVAEVRRFPTAVVSRVTCEPNDRDTIAAIYAANADGLRTLSELPDSAEALTAALTGEVILAATPEASSHQEEDEMGFGFIRRVSQDDTGAWCALETSWGGDESGTQICLREGVGITASEREWAGGATQTTRVWLQTE